LLDFYNIRSLFPASALQFQYKIREVLDKELASNINAWWGKNQFPKEISNTLKSVGAFGNHKKENKAQLDYLEYGLLMYELERIDSGIRSIVSVQNALVIFPIKEFGSDFLQKLYLDKLLTGSIIGCFGLTEIGGGSDPSSIQTTYTKSGNNYIISGKKSWVTNAPFAEISIIWAKEAKGNNISGFVIPTNSKGFNLYPIENKMSLRLSPTANIELDQVTVPASHKLVKGSGLSSALSCLSQARYGICWGVLGALESVYEDSLLFANSRATFGATLSSKQLVQEKLTNMVSRHTKGMLLSYQLSILLSQRAATNQQISLAKRENARAALISARNAREILAAQGITLDANVIRHMLNLETVDTYEGTYDIHTLIIGKAITGQSGF